MRRKMPKQPMSLRPLLALCQVQRLLYARSGPTLALLWPYFGPTQAEKHFPKALRTMGPFD